MECQTRKRESPDGEFACAFSTGERNNVNKRYEFETREKPDCRLIGFISRLMRRKKHPGRVPGKNEKKGLFSLDFSSPACYISGKCNP
jgi:hypothetical protein